MTTFAVHNTGRGRYRSDRHTAADALSDHVWEWLPETCTGWFEPDGEHHHDTRFACPAHP